MFLYSPDQGSYHEEKILELEDPLTDSGPIPPGRLIVNGTRTSLSWGTSKIGSSKNWESPFVNMESGKRKTCPSNIKYQEVIRSMFIGTKTCLWGCELPLCLGCGFWNIHWFVIYLFLDVDIETVLELHLHTLNRKKDWYLRNIVWLYAFGIRTRELGFVRLQRHWLV